MKSRGDKKGCFHFPFCGLLYLYCIMMHHQLHTKLCKDMYDKMKKSLEERKDEKMSVTEHKKQAPKEVRCKIVTISDTRTEETDKSGQLLHELLKEAGHTVTSYEIVKDDKESIQQAVLAGYHREDVDVVLTNGGTGITKRDVTIEAVSALLDKEIVGFGELFRMISYLEDIGSSAMLSRAIGGTIGRKVVFSMPGSSGAVRLAMNKLILPELGHITFELHRQ